MTVIDHKGINKFNEDICRELDIHLYGETFFTILIDTLRSLYFPVTFSFF